MPTRVAANLDPSRGVILTSENGLIGMGPPPPPGAEDPDTVDAGKSPVTLVPGASIVHHADSFALIRGGRLDVAVLGALQVSEQGDLASWRLPSDPFGSVGGAMDIALGARRRYAIMTHRDKAGQPKILERCTYPLTAPHCIDRIYTDLAVIDITDRGLVVRDIHPDLTFEGVRAATGALIAPSEPPSMPLISGGAVAVEP